MANAQRSYSATARVDTSVSASWRRRKSVDCRYMCASSPGRSAIFPSPSRHVMRTCAIGERQPSSSSATEVASSAAQSFRITSVACLRILGDFAMTVFITPIMSGRGHAPRGSVCAATTSMAASPVSADPLGAVSANLSTGKMSVKLGGGKCSSSSAALSAATAPLTAPYVESFTLSMSAEATANSASATTEGSLTAQHATSAAITEGSSARRSGEGASASTIAPMAARWPWAVRRSPRQSAASTLSAAFDRRCTSATLRRRECSSARRPWNTSSSCFVIFGFAAPSGFLALLAASSAARSPYSFRSCLEILMFFSSLFCAT
mmetsp:Transcript_21110/g.50932  ORF Transcript_21110/g.50932 Transcript_21110/m.50932 type:complete len:322 (-) Transcript_21110:1922-2887(-)